MAPRLRAGWSATPNSLAIRVRNYRHGVAGTQNRSDPFYTSRPGRTGIRLRISRQIAEEHGGGRHLLRTAATEPGLSPGSASRAATLLPGRTPAESSASARYRDPGPTCTRVPWPSTSGFGTEIPEIGTVRSRPPHPIQRLSLAGTAVCVADAVAVRSFHFQ